MRSPQTPKPQDVAKVATFVLDASAECSIVRNEASFTTCNFLNVVKSERVTSTWQNSCGKEGGTVLAGAFKFEAEAWHNDEKLDFIDYSLFFHFSGTLSLKRNH